MILSCSSLSLSLAARQENGPAVTADRAVFYAIEARGFVVVTSVGGARGRTPDLLPSSRGRDTEQEQPAKHPMPNWCAEWRSWALVYAAFSATNAGGQQPAAVVVVTDTDNRRSSLASRQ